MIKISEKNKLRLKKLYNGNKKKVQELAIHTVKIVYAAIIFSIFLKIILDIPL